MGAVSELDYTAFALVVSNRLVSINSDGRRMFNLV